MKILSLFVLLASSAFAAPAQLQDFDCTIKTFDTKSVRMHCEDFDSDFKVPTEMLSEEMRKTFKFDQKVHLYFQLDDIKKFKVAAK